MKKIIRRLPDFVFLTIVVVLGIRYTDLLTTAIILAFQILLAVLYHLCMTMFFPLTQAVPTVKTITTGSFNKVEFWKLRAIQIAYSYTLLIVLGVLL